MVSSHPSHNIHTNECAVLSIFPLRSQHIFHSSVDCQHFEYDDDDDGGVDKMTSRC